jgi:hypothetical protein
MKKYLTIAIILIILPLTLINTNPTIAKETTSLSSTTTKLTPKEIPNFPIKQANSYTSKPSIHKIKLNPTKSTAPTTKQTQIIPETPKTTNQETNSKSKNKPTEITAAYIKENLNIGMLNEELTTLIGSPNAKGVTAMDGLESWRYDFIQTEDYQFEEFPEYKEMGIVDTVDMEGLLNGDLQMQLFLNWKDGVISHIVLYEKVNNSINEYRAFQNGEIREMTIN